MLLSNHCALSMLVQRGILITIIALSEITVEAAETGTRGVKEGVGFYAQMEAALTELARPRYPPYTPMDAIKGNFKWLGAHYGDQIFVQTGLALDWLLYRIINGEMQQFLVEGVLSPLPPSVTGFLGDLAKAEDGRMLRFVLRTLARHKVYPQVGEFFLRWSTQVGVPFFAEKIADLYGETFLRLRNENLIRLILGLVQERAPPELFFKVLSKTHSELPTTLAANIFAHICQFQRLDRFLEYFAVLLKHFYRELGRVDSSIIKGAPHRVLFWELRELYRIFSLDNIKDIEGYTTAYQEMLERHSEAMRIGLRQIDWYLGNSVLFQAGVTTDGDLADAALAWTIKNAGIQNNWRALVDSNAVNFVWAAGLLQLNAVTERDCRLVVAQGTPALFASLLALYACPQNADELKKHVSEAHSPQLTEMARNSSKGQKLVILRLFPEAQRVIHELGEYSHEICGAFGSASRAVEVDLDWLDRELSTDADVTEATLAFIQMAFLVPRALIPSLELLPHMPSIVDLINAAVFQYCAIKRNRPVLRLAARERLPCPKWHLRHFDRSSLSNRIVL